jgi:hypothetical protein
MYCRRDQYVLEETAGELLTTDKLVVGAATQTDRDMAGDDVVLATREWLTSHVNIGSSIQDGAIGGKGSQGRVNDGVKCVNKWRKLAVKRVGHIDAVEEGAFYQSQVDLGPVAWAGGGTNLADMPPNGTMVLSHVVDGAILGKVLEEESCGHVERSADTKRVTVEEGCRIGIGHDGVWVAWTKKWTGAKGIVDSAVKGIAGRRS